MDCLIIQKKNQQQKERILGIRLVDGKEIRADFTIVAAGAWTPYYVPQLREGILSLSEYCC